MINYLKSLQQSRWRMIAFLTGILFALIILMNIFPGFIETFRMWRTIHQHKFRIKQVYVLEENFDQIQLSQIQLKKSLQDFIFSRQQETQLSSILDLISKNAQKFKITIESIQPGSVTKERGHLEMPIVLSLTARYHSLARFINFLETTEPVIKVIRFEVQSKSFISSQLDAQLYLIVYYLEQTI